MAVRAPTFVVDCVDQNKEVFQGQNKSVLISAQSTKASFAVFLYGFLTSDNAATRTALCVYGSEKERDEWREVALDVFRTNNRGRVVSITDLTDSEALPPAPFLAFLHYERLEELFPLRDALRDTTPFVSDFYEIASLTTHYSAHGGDPRAFAAFDTPVNYRNNRPDDPYSFAWDHLVFSRDALLLPSVYYLNAVAVTFNRYLLDDILEESGDVHLLYNTIYASTMDVPDNVLHEDDPVEVLIDAREQVYELVQIDDDLVSYSVVLPSKPVLAPPIASSSMRDLNVPPPRSVIFWRSVRRPCVEYEVDPSSRVSVLWVHNEALVGVPKLAKFETTSERFATSKTMMIYLYMWINNAKPFYVLCPYVSRAHELHKLQNVRPLHPEDELVHALREDDTLIIFDTIFANSSALRLTETRCRLIFAAFCGSPEESALAKFLCAEKGLPKPKLPKPFRMSPITMRRITIDPRLIQLQYDLTSVIFYDTRDKPHTTLYECMLRVYDHISGLANDAYFAVDYADVLTKMRAYYHIGHTAECSDLCLDTPENMRNRQAIDEEEQHRSMVESMSTMLRNYYRALKLGEDGPPMTINRIAAEFDELAHQLALADVRRLIALDTFLGRVDEEVSVRVVYNENAPLLRARIDNRERPPLPLADGEVLRPVVAECAYCGQEFDSRHYYRQHVAAEHKDDMKEARVFHCVVCDVRVKGEWQFTRHNRSTEHFERIGRSGERFVCRICDTSYTTKIAYDAHVEVCRPPETHTVCRACEVEVEVAALNEHRLTVDHQQRVSGPDQVYCQCCDVRCERGEEMRDHLSSEGHQRRYIAVGHIVPINIHLNRYYVLLASAERLIDQRGYYVDMELRRSLLLLPEVREAIGEGPFINYCTLLLISMTMKPATRKFYISADRMSGMLVATVKGRMGVVGHYGEGDKTVMIAELFSNMNVISLKHGSLAYVPSGLHNTLIDYVEEIGLKVTYSPLSTSFLGRLRAYHSYCITEKDKEVE